MTRLAATVFGRKQVEGPYGRAGVGEEHACFMQLFKAVAKGSRNCDHKMRLCTVLWPDTAVKRVEGN